jgi:hypothetical protein
MKALPWSNFRDSISRRLRSERRNLRLQRLQPRRQRHFRRSLNPSQAVLGRVYQPKTAVPTTIKPSIATQAN